MNYCLETKHTRSSPVLVQSICLTFQSSIHSRDLEIPIGGKSHVPDIYLSCHQLRHYPRSRFNLDFCCLRGEHKACLGTRRLSPSAGFLFYLRHGGVLFIPSDLEVVGQEADPLQAHHVQTVGSGPAFASTVANAFRSASPFAITLR
jgi:hypothetical protein